MIHSKYFENMTSTIIYILMSLKNETDYFLFVSKTLITMTVFFPFYFLSISFAAFRLSCFSVKQSFSIRISIIPIKMDIPSFVHGISLFTLHHRPSLDYHFWSNQKNAPCLLCLYTEYRRTRKITWFLLHSSYQSIPKTHSFCNLFYKCLPIQFLEQCKLILRA